MEPIVPLRVNSRTTRLYGEWQLYNIEMFGVSMFRKTRNNFGWMAPNERQQRFYELRLFLNFHFLSFRNIGFCILFDRVLIENRIQFQSRHFFIIVSTVYSQICSHIHDVNRLE